MEMDPEIIDQVNREIEKRFPYLKGISPHVQPREDNNYLLVYGGNVHTANGHGLPVNVRVVIDSTGKILKMSASR